jgi:hypothetical protein
MSRPTVTVISPKGEASNDTIPVPQVFKASLSILSQAAVEPPPARNASTFRLRAYFGTVVGKKKQIYR